MRRCDRFDQRDDAPSITAMSQQQRAAFLEKPSRWLLEQAQQRRARSQGMLRASFAEVQTQYGGGDGGQTVNGPPPPEVPDRPQPPPPSRSRSDDLAGWMLPWQLDADLLLNDSGNPTVATALIGQCCNECDGP